METSLLRTKFNITPTQPHLVNRPHLIERLQEGLHYNLILVSAPAGLLERQGYGKGLKG